jgi:hypothetical protein
VNVSLFPQLSGPRDGAVLVWGDIEDTKLDELAKGVA